MKKIQYLDLEHVMTIHDLMIDEMGGSYGVRDMGLVESATMQPRQSFGGFELYPSLFEKAAAYAFFLSENQPFIDGNKRTA
ncbi:MAG: Fic family protein, partial [Deltaproteobacteria bacterium]|nr:Fic family protein [Deltaproteobacteria bacterium]